MKPKAMAYGVYFVFSVLISFTIALIPAMFLFFYSFQNFDLFINGIGWPFVDIQASIATIFNGQVPQFVFDRLWFLIFIVPIGMFCYAIFLGFLVVMLHTSRRGIPYIEEGYYSNDSDEWVLHEYHQSYYLIFPYFLWFYSLFLDSRARHIWFGAKLGKGTILGNARLFTPDRVTIGKNCFIGFGSVVTGHVYEKNRMYLKTVEIGDNVTVGGYAIIFPGASIGDNSIIGANTVVPKDRVIPPNSIWVDGKAIPRGDSPTEKALVLESIGINGPRVTDDSTIVDEESSD